MFRTPSTLFTDAVSALSDSGQADAAVFGAPLEQTMSFREGAGNGPSAVRALSRSLEAYSPVVGRDLRDFRIVDLGDLSLHGETMESALRTIECAMEQAASAARLPVMIGGEHTISLAGFRAIRRVHRDIVLVQIDAHTDLREEYEGEQITHATWLYHAGRETDSGDIVQLGVRSGEREEWRTLDQRTFWSSPELILPPPVRDRLAGKPVYLTIDIDVLDPAYAPGTGSPEPGGFTFRELAAFLYSLAGLRVVAMDVVEVAPDLDPSGITAVTAAKLIREGILLFAAERER